MTFLYVCVYLEQQESQHVYHIIDKEAALEQAQHASGLLKKYLFVIVHITSILHVFVYAYITTIWSINGLSVEVEFNHVYSAVNSKKKKKTKPEQSKNESASIDKKVATCMTFHQLKHVMMIILKTSH